MVGKIFNFRLYLILILILSLTFTIGYVYTKRAYPPKKEIVSKSNVSQIAISMEQPSTSENHHDSNIDATNLELDTSDRLSPETQLEFRVFYTECGHSYIQYRIIPEAYIGLNEEELKSKLPGWSVQKFNRDYVVLTKVTNGKCPRHLIVKTSQGRVVVFYDNENNDIREITSILELNLKEIDRQRLLHGIKIDNEIDLQHLLEDFGS